MPPPRHVAAAATSAAPKKTQPSADTPKSKSSTSCMTILLGVIAFALAAGVAYWATAQNPIAPPPVQRVNLQAGATGKDPRAAAPPSPPKAAPAPSNFTAEIASRRVWARSPLSNPPSGGERSATCDSRRKLLVQSLEEYRSVRAALQKGDRTGAALPSFMASNFQLALYNAKLAEASFTDLVTVGSVVDAAVINDGYCDCDDGTDEPGTGVCDRTLRRNALSTKAQGAERCQLQHRSARGRLFGSRRHDGFFDCCDCRDEAPSAAASACRRNCVIEGKRAVARLEATQQMLTDGVAECRKRARFGTEEFAPAYRHAVADRELWLTEAEKFFKSQIERHKAPKGSAAQQQQAGALLPEADLQQFAEFLRMEGSRQQSYKQIIAAGALGEAFQYSAFAPRMALLGDENAGGDPAAAAARKKRFAAALDRNPLCVSATRHETDFRGGSADPESFNFTFVVCPFEHASMVKVEPTVAAAAAGNLSDEAVASNVSTTGGDPNSTTSGPTASSAKPTILGRYGVSGVELSLSSFDAFFANEVGARTSDADVAAEDPLVYFAMQTINKRPNAYNSTHAIADVPSGVIGRSPLHPFDYDLGVGPSVRNNTVWMSNGDDCWGGPHRHVRLAFVCSSADSLVDIRENGKCTYEAVVATPSACCKSVEAVATDVASRLREIEADLRVVRRRLEDG